MKSVVRDYNLSLQSHQIDSYAIDSDEDVIGLHINPLKVTLLTKAERVGYDKLQDLLEQLEVAESNED